MNLASNYIENMFNLRQTSHGMKRKKKIQFDIMLFVFFMFALLFLSQWLVDEANVFSRTPNTIFGMMRRKRKTRTNINWSNCIFLEWSIFGKQVFFMSPKSLMCKVIKWTPWTSWSERKVETDKWLREKVYVAGGFLELEER